jgi:hypothetical protein
MTDISVSRETGRDGGRLTAAVDGHVSELVFALRPAAGASALVALHTHVPSALSGRGVGLALVEALVAEARERGAGVDPQCSFVRRMMERRDDWRDLIVGERSDV